MQLVDLIQKTAKRLPGKEAVIVNSTTFTYRQIMESIEHFSAVAEKFGITHQQKVGLMFPNGAGYIIAFFAILKCDAIAVPVSSDLMPQDIKRLAHEMELDHIIVSPEFLPLFEAIQLDLRIAEIPMHGGQRTHAVLASILDMQKSGAFDSLSRMHAANIRFTSGTTADSKGVVLSHGTIYERLVAANSFFHINEKDTVIWTLSMAHHFTATICCHIMAGATIVVGTSLSPEYLIKLAGQNRGTILYATPMIYKLLARHAGKHIDALRHMRHCISTAMPLTSTLGREFRDAYHIPLTNVYGLIEVGIPIVHTIEDDSRAGALGKPTPAFEAQVFGPEGTVLNTGEIGNLALRGPGMLDAYCKPWQVRDDILQNGWFVTGDLARKDDDGYLFLAGRDSDIINVGGFKVFPYEVEELLAGCPGVREVLVTGEDDRRFGQIVKAYVVPFEGEHLSPEELLRFCRKRISFFKVPKKLELVDSLPKTSTGKLLRKKVRRTG